MTEGVERRGSNVESMTMRAHALELFPALLHPVGASPLLRGGRPEVLAVRPILQPRGRSFQPCGPFVWTQAKRLEIPHFRAGPLHFAGKRPLDGLKTPMGRREDKILTKPADKS
jgi:hypothetical protein